MNKFISFTLIFIFLFSSVAISGKKRKKRSAGKWYFKISTSAVYDNNILKYSDKYLNRFKNREDEGRFHIDTYDDLISNNSLYISRSFYLFKRDKKYKNKRYRSNINLKIQHKKYIKNKIKDWSYFQIGFNQHLPKHFKINFSYSYIPEFYVRHFRDDDWVDIYGYTENTFKPYAFKKDNFSFYLQKRIIKGTQIRLNYSFMRYFHNKHFTEYDSKNNLAGIGIYQSLGKDVSINFNYNFINSSANGFDETNENRNDSDDSDASYEQDHFELGLTYKFPKIKDRRSQLRIKSRFEPRYYSSKKNYNLDKLHVGREDKNIRIFVNYEIALSKKLDVTGIFNWYNRDSGSSVEENDTYVANEKKYKQYQVGLELTYSFRK